MRSRLRRRYRGRAVGPSFVFDLMRMGEGVYRELSKHPELLAATEAEMARKAEARRADEERGRRELEGSYEESRRRAATLRRGLYG